LLLLCAPAQAAEWGFDLGGQSTALVTQASHAVTQDRQLDGFAARAYRSVAAFASDPEAFAVELGYLPLPRTRASTRTPTSNSTAACSSRARRTGTVW
jgi:hypothetical protein